MATITEWYDFADRLHATAISMFKVLELPLQTDGQQYALTLLARTISNFEAAVVLHKMERFLEARIMMRCCYENLFYIGGIAKEGDVFVEAMKHEDAASRSARGRLLFEHELIDANSEDGQQLRDFLKTLSKTGRSLDPKSIATKGPIAQGYIIYSVVSEDAAHPTLMSLSRHVAAAEGGNMFSIVPTLVEEGEIEDTIIFTCAALLGACYATGEVLGRTLVAPEVKKRMDEMLVLQGLV